MQRTRTLQAPCARCRLPRRRQLKFLVGWTLTVPSHVAASTVCAGHTGTSSSVCSLSACLTPSAQLAICWTPIVPSHIAASTVFATHTDTAGSVCLLLAASTPSAKLFGRLDTDRAVTRCCMDGVRSTQGHFRSASLTPSAQFSVGWTPTVPSHVAASTVCAALKDTAGSVCSLSASPTPPAHVFSWLDTGHAFTRRCIDCVCDADGHFRLHVLAVGSIDAVSSDFGRLDTDRAVTCRFDGVCGAHRHSRLLCARCRLHRRRQLSCSVGWTPTVPSPIAALTVCAAHTGTSGSVC